MQSRWRAVLRWLGVLPTAVLAAWGGWVIYAFAGLLSKPPESDHFGMAWYTFVGSMLMGGCFVYAGGRMAPSSKPSVVYVLTCLLVAANVALIVWVRETLTSDAGMIVGAVAVAAAVVLKKAEFAMPAHGDARSGESEPLP